MGACLAHVLSSVFTIPDDARASLLLLVCSGRSWLITWMRSTRQWQRTRRKKLHGSRILLGGSDSFFIGGFPFWLMEYVLSATLNCDA